MAENSHISWTHDTFNGWIGCTKVSEGCKNCYAELRDRRHLIEKIEHWGKGAPRLRTSKANWRKPLQWNRNANVCELCGEYYPESVECLCSGQRNPTSRRRVFCSSLADWLDDEVSIEWLADLLQLIHATPHLDWLLLTKRPENWKPRLEAVADICGDKFNAPDPFSIAATWLCGNAPANVWLGTSLENQQCADHRIPALLAIPAKIRFLSCEPLLGSVDLRMTNSLLHGEDAADYRVDWVICGGESGPNARPMHPEWARSLRDQCQEVGVAFHFKQWGEWLPINQPESLKHSPKMPPMHSWTSALPHTAPTGTVRIGKTAAGRMLDGHTWDEFPQP